MSLVSSPHSHFGTSTYQRGLSLASTPTVRALAIQRVQSEGRSLDGFIHSSPACKRAVVETVAALRQAGHECIELDWPFGEILGVCYVRLALT
jgi:hypothetical protein